MEGIMADRYIGYVRVSTQQQGRSGLGLEAQQAAIRAYVRDHGGELVDTLKEVESGAHDSRPELAKALKRCNAQGCILLIAKLDRLSRNALFLLQLQESGLDFVCCDMPGANKLTIGIMALLAQQERELISARTKDALAAAKARGVKLGYWSHREAKDTLAGHRGSAKGGEAVKANANSFASNRADRVRELRAEGLSYAKIAERLNAEHYRTARGGRWHPTTVKNLLARLDAMAS